MKPKLIIEQHYDSNCIHFMIRVRDKKQVNFFIQLLKKVGFKKKSLDIMKSDFSDIFKFDKQVFSSSRIKERNLDISYLINDVGKNSKTAYIFTSIKTTKENFKNIKNYEVEKYFEL